MSNVNFLVKLLKFYFRFRKSAKFLKFKDYEDDVLRVSEYTILLDLVEFWLFYPIFYT